VIAAASSRVEAKLFSVMNAFRSRKKCSTRFIQVSDAVTAPLTVHHLVGADALLPQIADVLIADTAFDADDRVIRPLAAAGKSAVIPPRRNRLTTRAFDQELYKARNLIKNFFAKLKQFRAIATRYDKTARNFLAAVHLAAATIWLN